MIFLCKIKILISQFIYKSLIDLQKINVILKPGIVFFTFFRSFYKVYIPSSIIENYAPVMDLLVSDIFIKVHIVILDEKNDGIEFFSQFLS